MGKKTINQALKDLFLGLGGDSSALADNSSVSDYIEDLESAIKGAASGGAQIDDTTASKETVFSSSKTEELIEGVLPTVEAADIGEALIVESDGEGGAQWGKGVIAQDTVVIYGTRGNSAFNLPSGMTCVDLVNLIEANKNVVLYCTDSSYKAISHFAGNYTAAGHKMYAFMGMRKTGASTYIVDDIFCMSEDSPTLTWNTKTLTLS